MAMESSLEESGRLHALEKELGIGPDNAMKPSYQAPPTALTYEEKLKAWYSGNGPASAMEMEEIVSHNIRHKSAELLTELDNLERMLKLVRAGVTDYDRTVRDDYRRWATLYDNTKIFNQHMGEAIQAVAAALRAPSEKPPNEI